MTRIDFYHEAEDRLAVACRLAAKAVQQKMRVLIYVPDEARAKAIDQLLWTSPPIGFLPHCMADDKLAAETPILISSDPNAQPHDDVLLNLANEWAPNFARFQRVLEIVSREDEDKQQARERFKFYKDRGYAIQTHNLAEAKS